MNELFNEFDMTVGDFDNDRLNRAIFKAREEVVTAQTSTNVPRTRTVVATVQGYHARAGARGGCTVNGAGFADDLAIFGSFMAQLLVEDLIVATDLETVDADTLAQADANVQLGKAWRVAGVDEWERAVADFLTVARVLEPELNIGPPCS